MSLRFSDDKFDFNRDRAGELEKRLLVQYVVAPESSQRAKRRAALQAEVVRFFQEPFPRQDAVNAMPLMHVKSQE
jgi:hypothetical protein